MDRTLASDFTSTVRLLDRWNVLCLMFPNVTSMPSTSSFSQTDIIQYSLTHPLMEPGLLPVSRNQLTTESKPNHIKPCTRIAEARSSIDSQADLRTLRAERVSLLSGTAMILDPTKTGL